MPRTRIVCTLGPATDSDEILRDLIRAGMNVARLNFSHGTRDEHAARVERVRAMAETESATIALMGDLQGPKIRVGEIPDGRRILRAGETIVFALTPTATIGQIPLDFPFLGDALQSGDRFLLDDGALEVQVLAAGREQIATRVLTGGELSSHKGVNLPGVDLPIASLTDKDRADVEWAAAHDLDYLALSFVRRASDVSNLREVLMARKSEIPIIAKIEKREALTNIEAILDAADGVMVARGDLGVEMPAEQVPIYQKQIIRKANVLGKPVITATQMLESMIHNARPTRAEASDVANAILDGSDAVMLSAETAVGAHPVDAVRAMARIADYTEKNLHHYLAQGREFTAERLGVTDSIGQNTVDIAREIGAKLIITLTLTGHAARMVSRHRPEIPILAVTANEKTRRRLCLVWGVQSELIHSDRDTSEAVQAALEAARECGLAQRGDRVVITAGVPTGIVGRTNMIQVRSIE